ncbi:MAG TPA: ferritin-like domain-containing protein, partial [Candidatus Polarisedimenticolia bacterium]|nr:ferritin-like domain-containing protein [Candidatus Polarisedimenticolia bacterium]
GARVEPGSPSFDFALTEKDLVWADEAAALYAQAASAQWDPARAVDWDAPITHPAEVEDAVVQVMTYLIENETAALMIPASFLARIHPHFREILQVLAIQAADEARHIEVFTRRALLLRKELGLSTAGGQASLRTLLDEPDFALSSFLLSVLGEGSFVSLLRFLDDNAPDPVTRQVTRLAAQDEVRHVAFGLAHLQRQIGRDPGLRTRLALAVQRRHDALRHTTGLNEEVFDALIVLAAGSWEPADIASGFDRVAALQHDMDAGRRRRLERLGFDRAEAEALSALHTRNFM